MKSEGSTYKSPELELDEEGFVRSFDLQTCNKEQLEQFYHKFGFLIFRDVVNEKEVKATIDALWKASKDYLQQYTDKKIDRNDQSTWGQIVGYQAVFGFVGDGVLEQIQFWLNRKNPKVYQCFKLGYEANTRKPLQEPLIASLDRGSMMLPSGINPEWKTKNLYHFDIDPWLWTGKSSRTFRKYRYNPQKLRFMLGQGNYQKNVGYTKLAGVLALSDTNENSGGFQCACGFQNYIHKWCQENPEPIHITDDKNLVQNFKRIFMRKGSLLIFSRQLPHNIYQNVSKQFRYAQYLRMSPLSALQLDQQLIKARKKLLKLILPKKLDVSDKISKQIFMLDNSQEQKISEQKKQEQEIKKQVNQTKQEQLYGIKTTKRSCQCF